MTKPKYRTVKHKEQRRRLSAVVANGKGWCAETVCLVERDGGTRWIPPGTPWDVAHHDDGVTYKGPSHVRCNRSEGASRGNRMRAGKATIRRRAL